MTKICLQSNRVPSLRSGPTSVLLLLRRATWLGLALAVLMCVGCEGGLPKYNQLEGFRVLALRASPPSLNGGESTTLDALTFVEGEPVSSLRYRWSWCPARLPSTMGGDCALDEAAFARLLGLDGNDVDFDLGDQATAKFTYPGQAELYQVACENSASADDKGAFVFSCEGGFPISIRADITYQEQTIRIQKEVRLLFGDLPTNKNPELGALSFLRVNSDTAPQPWPEETAAQLALGERYEVQVEVAEASAERFVPEATVVVPSPKERQESLYISWFVSSGEMDQDRTSFIENGVSLAKFGKNEWLLPKAGDEKRNAARMLLVLRDERGGVSWLSRTVELTR
jgi:hypothetical protein